MTTGTAQPETASDPTGSDAVARGGACAIDGGGVRRPGGASGGNGDAQPTLFQRLEAWVSRLSTRNNFWHRVCSLIWLPFAFRSGITMRRIDSKTFTAVLPFKRVNRNWYNAMAGAALLGNSEVAAGMYLFSRCGSDYIVVCKELKYRFLRPCLGPAVYHIVNCEEVDSKIAAGGEFNVGLELEIRQQIGREDRRARRNRKARGGKPTLLAEKRVGRCEVTFHCTPKDHFRDRQRRARERREERDAAAKG